MNSFNDGLVMKCYETILSELSTPLGYKVWCLIRSGNLEKAMELRINPSKYTCPATLLQDQQALSFLKKYEDLPFSSKEKKSKKAEDLFWQSEHMCFETNRRLDPLLSDSRHYGERMETFVSIWRKKIRRILGRAPSWAEVEGRFGTGATFDNIGNLTSVADKLTEGYTVTKICRELTQIWDMSAWSRYAACGLQPMAEGLEQLDGAYAIRDLEHVRGNRFTVANKDWDKYRGICIEPSVCVFYQLGIGKLIARKLKRHGLDKWAAQNFHRLLAKLASLTGACATIDLSNASDTVCYVLPKLVLPDDWFSLIDEIRSPMTLFKGHWVRLEKFSSMGNGFTFELETLIFYTLALTVAEVEGIREDPFTPGLTISCYGDDIIVPSSIAPCVISALRFFGFTPNDRKTFLTGKFRESCGGDYLHGFDVRPFYLKVDIDESHRIIATANSLLRVRLRGHATGLGENFLAKPWRKLLHGLPSNIRRTCIGPSDLGDIVIHDIHWERHARPRVRNSIRYLRTWRPVLNRRIPTKYFRPGVEYAAKLYGDTQLSHLLTDFRGKPLSPFTPKIRGSFVSGYKLGWVPYS